MTSEELAALREIVGKLRDSRWFQNPYDDGAVNGDTGMIFDSATGLMSENRDNAIAACALRNAAPRLLDEVERLTKRVGELEAREAAGNGALHALDKTARGASSPDGTCAVCHRTAPLVDSECPDCRH